MHPPHPHGNVSNHLLPCEHELLAEKTARLQCGIRVPAHVYSHHRRHDHDHHDAHHLGHDIDHHIDHHIEAFNPEEYGQSPA